MDKINALPDSLTKENFWNGMMEKYPAAMQKFCKWIDEYKQRVKWAELFTKVNCMHEIQQCPEQPPKYHDLPLAMQIGIFLQFVSEVNEQAGHTDSSMENLVESIPRFLAKTNIEKLYF